MTETTFEGCVTIALNRPQEPTSALVIQISGELMELYDTAGHRAVKLYVNQDSVTLAPRRKADRKTKTYTLQRHHGKLCVEVRDKRVLRLFGDQPFSATPVDVQLSGIEDRVRIPRLSASELKRARDRFSANAVPAEEDQSSQLAFEGV